MGRSLFVWDLNADDALARNGRDDPYGSGLHGERQVVCEVCDLSDLYAGRGFEFVHGDDRAGAYLQDLTRAVEVVKFFLKYL